MAKILVVDDEKNIVELIKFNLVKENFKVIEAYNGIDALKLFRQEKPDLVILDIMMPGMGGLEVCRQIRKESRVPIIMLTAKSDEIDKVIGLELGADDYVTKPFSPRELVARVKAVLRRAKPSKHQEQEEYRIADFVINVVKREVRVRGKLVQLKPKEFELLKLLATNPGRVFTRDYLLEQIWGYNYLGDTRTVDVHMRRLRKKVEVDPSNPRYLKTVHGVGYKFHYEPEEEEMSF